MNRKQSVLLVDNDQEFHGTMKKILEKSGYSVRIADDGREAIDFLSRYTIDLIVSEVKVPDLCGIELMKEIKRREIDVPVIFMTAHGEVESYMDLMNMGAFDYLNKPLKEQEILEITRKAMGA